MAKNYKEINSGSRTALVKSSNLYGGQILTANATAPDGAIYDLGEQTSSTYTVRAEITSNGNGDGGTVLLTFSNNSLSLGLTDKRLTSSFSITSYIV